MPVRGRRQRDAGAADASGTPWCGTPTSRESRLVSGTATGCTARTNPQNGHRCNPSKLLLDPYAKALEGAIDWAPACFSYTFGDPKKRNTEDSGPHTMKSVVINPFFDWRSDRPPRHPYHETVIYEAHVKGLTQTHPDIPEEIRGTYAGLAHPAMIEHLTDLGVTAIELMPVHQFVNDSTLEEKGLANYWGYNTIGFFAPHNAYSSSGQTRPAGAGVQGDGPDAARGRHRGHPRRRLQPHRRGQPPRPDARRSAASTTRRTTGWSTTTRATTTTPPAPATRC